MVFDGDPPGNLIYKLKKRVLFAVLNQTQGRVFKIQVMRIQ